MAAPVAASDVDGVAVEIDRIRGRDESYLDVGVDRLERRQSRDQPAYEEDGVAAYRQNQVGLRCDQVVSRTCDPEASCSTWA